MDNVSELKKIVDVYGRLQLVLGTDRIVVVGGCAMKLTCDPERPLHDIDLAVSPKFLYGVQEDLLADNGFSAEYEDGKLLVVMDKATNIEVEVSSKTCGNLNNKLGIPPYTESNPTVLGVNLNSVIDEGIFIDVYGKKIRVPNHVQQLVMKYNLWLFRGNGQIYGQKDAEDIRKIINAYYLEDGELMRNAHSISSICKSRDSNTIMKDINMIKAGRQNNGKGD